LFGVFDVDSPRKARFTAGDRAGLERLVAAFEEIR
jgi:putative methionine-R-sulfoxide reductase with GAF domain